MIYFIQDSSTHFIKIGHTDGEAAERLRALQTGCPSGLMLLSTQPGVKDDERALHQRFAEFRERGEWFRPAPTVIRHILSAASLAAHDAGRAEAALETVGQPSVIPARPALPRQARIYLAGKIRKGDWRTRIVSDGQVNFDGSCGSRPDDDWLQWPVLENAIFDVHHYVGPYFVSCDHGCFHGDDTHGCGAGNVSEDHSGATNENLRIETVANCLAAIRDADLVFAWIDEGDCYGTIAELGYARALNKTIWISGPKRFRDMWFAYQMADATRFLVGETPDVALQYMLIHCGGK